MTSIEKDSVRDTLAYKIAGKLSNQGLIRRSDIGKVRAGIEQMLQEQPPAQLCRPPTDFPRGFAPENSLKSFDEKVAELGLTSAIKKFGEYYEALVKRECQDGKNDFSYNLREYEFCVQSHVDLFAVEAMRRMGRRKISTRDFGDELQIDNLQSCRKALGVPPRETLDFAPSSALEEVKSSVTPPSKVVQSIPEPVTSSEKDINKIATADEVYKRQQAIPSLRQPKNTLYQKRITVVTGFKPMSVDSPLDWRGVDFSDKRFRNYCCGYCECQMYDSAILKNMLWKHHPMFNTSYPMAELVSKMDAAHASSCAIHEYTLEYTKLHQFVHQIFRKIGVKDLGEMEAEAKRWLGTIIPYTPETFDERAESRRPSPKHFLGIVRGLDGTLGFRLPDAETFILGRRDPYSSPFLNGVWFERWPTEKELMCLIALKGPSGAFCFGIPNEFHKHGN